MPRGWWAKATPDAALAPLELLGEPLPPSERDDLLQAAADAVRKRGLVTPAILALEIHRPLAWVTGQSLIALTPLFGPLLGARAMGQISRLLSEEGNVERLIERLEAENLTPPAPLSQFASRERGESRGNDTPGIGIATASLLPPPPRSELGEGGRGGEVPGGNP